MALPKFCQLCRSGPASQNAVTSHVYGGRDSQAFFHCGNCDIRYLFPGLTSEEESQFYAEEFESFMAARAGEQGGWDRAEAHLAANEPTRVRRMKYVEGNVPSGGHVLEVGCSSGFMLYPLVTQGFQCMGIAPSGVFSDYVEGRGISVYPSVESMVRQEDRVIDFDLIMHFFVLEHVSRPKEFLNEQLALLAPGGKLIFEVPNAADPLYSIYDIPAFERFYWSVAHAWYFSRASLEHLLTSLGTAYEIMGDQRYDLSNHMVWARDGRPGGMGQFSHLLGQEIEDQYRDALIKTGYCDTLVAIVSKD